MPRERKPPPEPIDTTYRPPDLSPHIFDETYELVEYLDELTPGLLRGALSLYADEEGIEVSLEDSESVTQVIVEALSARLRDPDLALEVIERAGDAAAQGDVLASKLFALTIDHIISG